jgi:transcriptional regulator with XRE-family HTH domain
MGRSSVTALPQLQQRMTAFGEKLRLARLRRRLTTTQVSERAGITRPTLYAIERGDPAVSFGLYANVLFCLGLDKDLDLLARDDELGRKLQDAQLMEPGRGRRKLQSAILDIAEHGNS